MSRTKVLLTMLILCLALSLVYLMASYFKVQKDQNALTSQINNTTQNLRIISSPAENLNQRLEQAKADNQSAKRAVSGNNTDMTEVISLLLKTADECNLEVDPVLSEQWSEKNIGSSTYQMLPIDLIITGRQADFFNYLADLENRQLFPSLAVEGLIITPNDPTKQTSESDMIIKLSLSLLVRSNVTN